MNSEKLFNRMGFVGQLGRLGTVIQALRDGKVDKADGKGLSSNDFTDEYKEYLDRVMHAEGQGDA